MINKIYENCPTSTIYTGFIGYTDFSEIDFQYVDTPGQMAYTAAMLFVSSY